MTEPLGRAPYIHFARGGEVGGSYYGKI